VLTPWAGEGYGARFLPRIGEIVVIDFFDGDIDRPFVLGASMKHNVIQPI
jgi:type VI secretion system secreted protein VgrG